MEFGCKLSPYDVRDYKIKAGAVEAIDIPDEYICELAAPVKNQKSISSCVAHATSTILEHHAAGKYDLSTDFIYGAPKALCDREGKGMYLRDACKIVKDYGDMLLEDCPGNTEVPECYSKAESALQDSVKVNRAKAFRILKYFSCATPMEIKQAIYKYGPVLACIRWYNDFKVSKNGVLTSAQTGDYSYHAVVIYGYTPDGFWCQNSWGTTWGSKGKFFIPNEIGIYEARGFVDLENNVADDLIEPKTNKYLDILYKILNFILNFIIKVVKQYKEGNK